MENFDLRSKRNLRLFIISYIINNFASGIMYDTYVNYMQEVSKHIAASFWAFYGYATFISAFVILAVPKTGYKKILMLCSLGVGSAFFLAVYADSSFFMGMATLFALTGVQIHFIILAPFVAAYTEGLGDKGIKWYTKAYYMGYVGYFISTYIGGVAVVKLFAYIAGTSYSSAKRMTEYVIDMDRSFYSAYLEGNRYILIAVGILVLLSLIPVILIREKREDYTKVDDDERKPRDVRIKSYVQILLNKDAVIYIIYWVLISFAMGLFTSYYTVFLNRNLHIDRATSSLMVSVSYLAIVIFMLFTPFVSRKIGRVGTITFAVLLSVPFMLIIGSGNLYGKFTVPIVGTALFIRAGLANLSSPVESSLSMAIVPRELRPAYTAIINFLAGAISVVSGTFTGKVLFTNQNGYEYAYYIAAAIYFVAGLFICLGLRKYDRREAHDELQS